MRYTVGGVLQGTPPTGHFSPPLHCHVRLYPPAAARYRDCPLGEDAADRGDRRQAGRWRRRPGALRQVQGQGIAGSVSSPGRRAGRQAGVGDGHHAHARRRRQDHHQHRAVRRLEPDRQTDERLPPRAVVGPVLRHEGRRHRRRLRPGDADGGHQSPVHRRLPRRRDGPQPPGRDAGQPHPARQRPGRSIRGGSSGSGWST